MALTDDAADLQLPDENRIRLPPRWKPVRLPRRGVSTRRRVRIDESASARLREQIATFAADLHAALGNPDNRQYADAGLAYLAGRPDPLGAGVVRALIQGSKNRKFTTTYGYGINQTLQPYFDAWATDHGTEFALRATVEALGVAGSPPLGQWQRGRLAEVELHEPDVEYWSGLDKDLIKVRSLLASVPEAEYDALVSSLAEHRDTGVKRIATAVLMPEQHSRVKSAIEEHTDPTVGQWMLWMTTGEDQLAALGESRLRPECVTKPWLSALIESFGVQALSLLRRTLAGNGDASQRRLLLTAISVLPSDDAVEVLLGELERVDGMSAAMETATRFPVRTVRSIANSAPGSAPEHRVNLGRLARSTPMLLEQALPRLGDKDQAAISDLLDSLHLRPDATDEAVPEPLKATVRTTPEGVDWVRPSLLPQILLRGGEAALPTRAVDALLTDLAEWSDTAIDAVSRYCDGESAARFSWALFERWLTVGAPAKDRWAFAQLRHLADDDVVARLTPMIKAWPGENHHQRAVHGLKLLGAIGSETALRALHGIAQKAKFKGLRYEAEDQMEAVAAGLGLSADQLADRLVPDFGLDDAAGLTLDYGHRRFTIGLDEQLKPFVTDADGKRRKNLPKPGVKDDAEVAGASYQRYSQLKKDLRTVASDQIKRLEQAMVAGRTWSKPEFEELFVGHPLVRHLARRLVWLTESGGEQEAFRLDEDQTCTDADEDRLELRADSIISVAHPIHLGGKVDQWSEIFADYEILQPFEQLTRPVMAFTDEELATGRLERFEGVTVPSGSLLGLENHGWSRAAPVDNGAQPGIGYALPDGGYVCVQLDPGFTIGIPTDVPEQTLTSVKLSSAEDYGWYRRGVARPHPTDIDPLTASEALIGLARVTAARITN